MTQGINKVILVGRVGTDPDTRTMPTSETVVTNLSLATSEKWNKRDGGVGEDTQWHRVALYGRVAEIARDFVKKGSLLWIEGKLKTRKYEDRDGVEKWTTEVIVNFPGQMQILSKKDDIDENVGLPKTDQPSSEKIFDDPDGIVEDDIPF